MSHHADPDALIAALLAGAAGFLLGRWTAIDGHAEPCDYDDNETLDLTIGNQYLESEEGPMISKEFVIGDGPAIFTVRPTHKGMPATLDSPVTVEVADPAMFSATVLPDGLRISFDPLGPAGSTTATIKANVAHSGTVIEKQEVVDLSAVPSTADTLEGDFGDQSGGTVPNPSVTPTPTPPPVTPTTPA